MDFKLGHYPALKSQLAALTWTPISESNLPKVGDEVIRVRPGMPVRVHTVEIDCVSIAVAEALGDTHRRPINPPSPERGAK